MIRKRSKLNNDFPYKKRKICKKEVECEICLDKVNEVNIINVHDNHFKMCKECLSSQATALLNNRDLLPWKCSECKESLSLSILQDVMSNDNYNKLVKRQTEMVIGSTISCPNCDSTYCISNDLNLNVINCDVCSYEIRFNENEKANNQELINLANQEGWAKCPGCNDLIERIDGCNFMTHHENDGSTTYFCYCCNEKLSSEEIGQNGKKHFPNGSFEECINCNIQNDIDFDVFINGISSQIYDNVDFDNVDFDSFDWNLNLPEYEDSDNGSTEPIFHCTECDYYGFSENALQQHIEAKDHEEKFYCEECSYYGFSENALQQHLWAKNH